MEKKLNYVKNIDRGEFWYAILWSTELQSRTFTFDRKNKTMIIYETILSKRENIEKNCEKLNDEEWELLANEYTQENTCDTLEKFTKVNNDNYYINQISLQSTEKFCEEFNLSYEEILNNNQSIKVIKLKNTSIYTNDFIVDYEIYTLALVNN